MSLDIANCPLPWERTISLPVVPHTANKAIISIARLGPVLTLQRPQMKEQSKYANFWVLHGNKCSHRYDCGR